MVTLKQNLLLQNYQKSLIQLIKCQHCSIISHTSRGQCGLTSRKKFYYSEIRKLIYCFSTLKRITRVRNCNMADDESMLLNGGEFVQIVYVDRDTVHNLSLIENGVIEVEEIETESLEVEDLGIGTLNEAKRGACNVGGVQILNKPKRRAVLTEFGDDLPNKRKNECAKRELTSIVNQVKLLIIFHDVKS